jgi:phosphoribosylglycinamide formyltransferase-1
MSGVMRVAVLVSGTGTNLAALLDAEAAGRLAPAEIALVLSNRPGVAALDRATAAGKPAVVVDHRAHPDRAAFEAAVMNELRARSIDALVLAGFMRILTDGFVAAWDGRVINTHPSLLPAFPGVDAVRQALDHGARVTGCTIHFVDATLDGGPIIAQSAVPVQDGDDVAALHARILAEEHRLLPEAVRLLASGRLRRDGRRVRVV